MESSRESVAQALTYIGYQIDKNWKFRLRNDERTASAFINKNGYVYDFGSGFRGDLVNILQEYHNIPKGEAYKRAKELLGVPIEIDFSKFEKRQILKKEGFIDEKYLLPFINKSKECPSVFSKLLQGLLPSVTCEKARNEIALKFDIGLSAGFFRNGTPLKERLVMPIRNEEGRIITFWKYNPFLEPKNKLRYTIGRNRGAFNIKILLEQHKKNEIIYVCEGEKDVLNATAYGLKAVTPGGAACVFKKDQIELFKDFRVLILGDNDEAGENFNNNIEKQLNAVAKCIRKLNWMEFLKSKKNGFVPFKGFDLTDYLKIKNSN